MAQVLEKLFLEKVAEMPEEEYEISALTTKGPVKGARKSTIGIFIIRIEGLIEFYTYRYTI